MATYTITNLAELQAMQSHLADDCVLANDIDCSDTSEWNAVAGSLGQYNGFDPIGQSGTDFIGTFDGGGFTLSNLYINWSDRWCGLFGSVSRVGAADGGFIKDLTITNSTILGASGYRGVLAGSITGKVGDFLALSDVNVYGEITSSGSAAVGGSCGFINLTDCTDCSAGVKIQNTYYAGGFVQLQGDGATLRCSSSGSISFPSAVSSIVGGFVSQTADTPTYDNCQSATAISVTSTNGYPGDFGGFVGKNNGGDFTLCYSSGAIALDISGYTRTGGFVGQHDSGSYDQCGANTTIVCPKAGGAVAGFTKIAGFGGGVNIASNCYARGSVCAGGIQNNSAATGLYLAGFGGTLGTITKCYAACVVGVDIPGSGSTIVAGGFGSSGSAGNADNFFDVEVSGYIVGIAAGTTSGVTGETTANMKLEATYVNWDFDLVWDIATFYTPSTPQSNLTVWLSKIDDYDNFEEGLNDDDSFSVVLPTTNEIRWMGGLEYLVVGTSGGEWKIASNKLDTPLAPTSYSAKRHTTYGSAKIAGISVNSAILFVDYVGRKLREISYSPSQEKFTAPDMTELAEHVTKSGIVDLAHQKNPNSVVWVVLANGNLLSMVYDREQDVVAWSEHITDGSVLSVCVVPGPTEDLVWITVARDNGTFIERKMPEDFGTDISDAFFVDSGITATSPGTTMSGLDHLEGQDVIVMGDGVEQEEGTPGDFTVASGDITIPAGLTTIHAGLDYSWVLQPMRIALGTSSGTSFGSNTRISEMVVSFLNTLGAQYGNNSDDLYDIDFDDIRWENEDYIAGLFSGDVTVTLPGGFSAYSPIIVSGHGPYPATVRLIIAKIDKVGR